MGRARQLPPERRWRGSSWLVPFKADERNGPMGEARSRKWVEADKATARDGERQRHSDGRDAPRQCGAEQAVCRSEAHEEKKAQSKSGAHDDGIDALTSG